MEQFTFLNIVLVFLGMTLNALIRLRRVLSKNGVFNFGFFVKDNALGMIISLLLSFTMLILASDIVSMLGLVAENGSSFYRVHAFLCGFMPHALFAKFLKTYKR